MHDDVLGMIRDRLETDWAEPALNRAFQGRHSLPSSSLHFLLERVGINA